MNTDNMKRYVGSSLDLSRRENFHFWNLEQGTHPNAPLQSSWNKHGKYAFVWTPLEVVDKPEGLREREQWWIDHLTPFREYGYNICKFSTGVAQREEIREKLRISMTGYVRSPEHCNNIRLSKLGHTLSKESRDKISGSRKGKCVGSSNCNAKLTDNDVIEMRKAFVPRKNGTQLRKKYGISKPTFYKIINREMWKHI